MLEPPQSRTVVGTFPFVLRRTHVVRPSRRTVSEFFPASQRPLKGIPQLAKSARPGVHELLLTVPSSAVSNRFIVSSSFGHRRR